MSALHHILTETPISQQLPYVLPPFTEKQLKEGLRTSWTAEQIGRLAVKYESEWYADESLSKWNEIDDFYEKERQAKQEAIQKELEDKKNSKPAAVEYAQEALTAIFKFHINEWNIEKNQRIKPSLWWNEVVTAQQAQTESTTAPVLSKLPTDGKVWHLHPVGMNIFFETTISGVCPIDPNYRSHFILHCTAGNMSESSIKAMTNFDKDDTEKLRSKAHKYVMKDGKVIEIWPFTEKNVWATKAESRNNLKGQMFHVELNYGPPDIPSEEQYQVLADLYIEAATIEGCWPIIVPHIEIDRGIKDGHGDPTDFDYNKFYNILKSRDVPIDIIPHFSHDRYWGHNSYKTPWVNDVNNWPPKLSGNPHKN